MRPVETVWQQHILVHCALGLTSCSTLCMLGQAYLWPYKWAPQDYLGRRLSNDRQHVVFCVHASTGCVRACSTG